jgi:defect-in-organelle-trafficking protein DotC
MTIKFKKLTLITMLSMVTSVALADTYPGLNYPVQEVVKKSSGYDNLAPQLNQLLSDKIQEQGKLANESTISEVRRKAIIDIASALGASGGLAYRMAQIKIDVSKNATELDKLFDFNKVLIENGVLAPVLTEGLSNYAQDSDDQIRIADKIYKIEAPAKFVSVYPTWRSYLMFSYPNYEMPPSAYLPKNAAEKSLWDETIKDGWKNGMLQADNIFEASYNRLERDYKGMIKYKILLAEGLITPTIVAKQNLGVTGGGKEMSINDQLFRITDHSSLNPNQSDWKVEYPITNNINGVLK